MRVRFKKLIKERFLNRIGVNNFFGDDEEASEGNRGNAPYSVWGE